MVFHRKSQTFDMYARIRESEISGGDPKCFVIPSIVLLMHGSSLLRHQRSPSPWETKIARKPRNHCRGHGIRGYGLGH